MNKLLIISLLCSLSIHSMDIIDKQHEQLAGTIMTSVFENPGKLELADAIMLTKKILEDDSLSCQLSLLVKKVLVDKISQQVVQCKHVTHLDEAEAIHELVFKSFIDGTSSLEALEHFPPLDKSSPEMIRPKPLSPWHSQSFESFIKAYYSACSAHKERK